MTLTVQNDVCAVFDSRKLFYIHLLKFMTWIYTTGVEGKVQCATCKFVAGVRMF